MNTTIEKPLYVFDAANPSYRRELAELWQYRELVVQLTWRNLTVAYKQSLLGLVWLVIGPLWSMVIYSIIFGGLVGIDAGDDVPYPIFSYSGLLIWGYFTAVLTGATQSIVKNKGLITKIYFPRLVLPATVILEAVFNFLLSLLILFGLMLFYGINPTWRVLTLPFFLLLMTAVGLGLGLFAAVLYVQYRDVSRVIGFFQQFMMYLTPIIYPIAVVPERWQTLYSLNPLTIGIQGTRWALLGQEGIALPLVLGGSVIAALIMIAGMVTFIRGQSTFADTV